MALTKTELNIRTCLETLRVALLHGDNSRIFCWAIPHHLACSQRPLRDHPVFAPYIPGKRPQPLPVEARPVVEQWVDRIISEGMQSVICLLEPAQLDKYYVRGGLNLSGGGLLEYYRLRGLWVEHRNFTDYQRPSEAQMRDVLGLFQNLPHPVLIHCSAGIDRTTPTAAFVADHWSAPSTPAR